MTVHTFRKAEAEPEPIVEQAMEFIRKNDAGGHFTKVANVILGLQDCEMHPDHKEFLVCNLSFVLQVGQSVRKDADVLTFEK